MASAEFAKCWLECNWFQKKNVKSPRLAPPNDRKKSKCLVTLILRRFRGGAVEGFMGGQSRHIFRGGPVKKTPCMTLTQSFISISFNICFIHQDSQQKTLCWLKFSFNRWKVHSQIGTNAVETQFFYAKWTISKQVKVPHWCVRSVSSIACLT